MRVIDQSSGSEVSRLGIVLFFIFLSLSYRPDRQRAVFIDWANFLSLYGPVVSLQHCSATLLPPTMTKQRFEWALAPISRYNSAFSFVQVHQSIVALPS